MNLRHEHTRPLQVTHHPRSDSRRRHSFLLRRRNRVHYIAPLCLSRCRLYCASPNVNTEAMSPMWDQAQYHDLAVKKSLVRPCTPIPTLSGSDNSSVKGGVMRLHLINLMMWFRCKRGIARWSRSHAGLRLWRCRSFSSDNGRCSENYSRPITAAMPVACIDRQRPPALSVVHHSLGMLLVE